MAEKKEKDNFLLYVGGIVAVTVVLVMMLKADEVKHLNAKAPELTKEQITTKNTHPGNTFVE